MSRARSAQVHVLIIRAPDGRTWAIGTPSQRGFTEVGAARAEQDMRLILPRGWALSTMEITPIDEVTRPLDRAPVPGVRPTTDTPSNRF